MGCDDKRRFSPSLQKKSTHTSNERFEIFLKENIKVFDRFKTHFGLV